jgi:hypothetical protein
VKKIAQLKRQAVAYIDRYFAGTVSPGELSVWASAQPVFANPKELDNNEDWMVSNALALMVALAEDTLDRSAVEKGLEEARQFLRGEKPFPEDHWPTGLSRQGR